MPVAYNLSNQRFGRLLAIKQFENVKGKWKWLCKCNCGNETVVYVQNLVSGHTQSCGCLNREITSRLGSLRTGENNFNYDFGIISESQKFKKSIRERDNHTCQECGKVWEKGTRRLDVHHIDGDGYNDISENAISLCVGCHAKITCINRSIENVYSRTIKT